jgi:hypothetical protein
LWCPARVGVDAGHGFLAQVATLGNGRVVVLVEQDGAGEADHGLVVGEDSDHVAASLDLWVDQLERVRRRDLAPVTTRERGVREHVGRDAVEDGGGSRELAVEDPHHHMHLVRHASADGWGDDRADGCGHHVLG